MVHSLSSVSNHIRPACQAKVKLSALNFSPKDKSNPFCNNCLACSGFPRKPWKIHFTPTHILITSSTAFTQCKTNGLPVCFAKSICAWKQAFCSDHSPPRNLSKPHSAAEAGREKARYRCETGRCRQAPYDPRQTPHPAEACSHIPSWRISYTVFYPSDFSMKGVLRFFREFMCMYVNKFHYFYNDYFHWKFCDFEELLYFCSQSSEMSIIS